MDMDKEEKIVPFVGPDDELPAGEAEVHCFGLKKQKNFTRSITEVKKEMVNMKDSIIGMLEPFIESQLGGFKIDTIDISLGFDAKGKLSFIAEGGIQASIKITIKKSEKLIP